jgi:hypothetical protein
MDDKLHVVTMYAHSESRLKHYERFADFVERSGAILYTVEVSHTTVFYVTSACNPRHLQLLTICPQIWHKERAINLAIGSIVPPTAEYIAWMDADIILCNPDWVKTAVHLLKRRWRVIHMFSHTQDLGPAWQPVGEMQEGYVYRYVNGRCIEHGHEISGLGWAARRSVLINMPLLDWAISSGADSIMACAFFGKNQTDMLYHTLGYHKALSKWQNTANKIVGEQVGYVQGLALHSWHGPRDGRGYKQVERILLDDEFNPDTDIKLSGSGLYTFTGNNKKLEKDMMDWYLNREVIE